MPKRPHYRYGRTPNYLEPPMFPLHLCDAIIIFRKVSTAFAPNRLPRLTSINFRVLNQILGSGTRLGYWTGPHKTD